MKKVSENPPSRYPERPLNEAPERWWIAKVKPRQEKLLAFDFIDNGIEFYLPFYTKVSLRPGTKKHRKSILPLFPGYISFSQKVPHEIFSTGRIVNIITIRHQQRFVRELMQIERALNNGFPIEPVLEAFHEEEEVVVTHGSLKGIRGVVASVRNNRKLILTVECLGHASMEIDMSCVRSVKSGGVVS